jgi:hypothetical protein
MNTPPKHNFHALEPGFQSRFKAAFSPISKTNDATLLTFFLAI